MILIVSSDLLLQWIDGCFFKQSQRDKEQAKIDGNLIK
jgi:hypothetical protein